MIWEIKDKEHTVKTCFALFPTKIGDYRVWLQRYYKTWDGVGPTWHAAPMWYTPHWFVFKEDAEEYVRKKMATHD